ncbi:MAG: hypothetical protein OXC46_00920 [Thaumarchaeota archaeon]|nr:hypothetical protein [Nitrososphaerota archaeon]
MNDKSDDVNFWIKEVISEVTSLKYLRGDNLIDSALEDAHLFLSKLENQIKSERILRDTLNAQINASRHLDIKKEAKRLDDLEKELDK